jgi:endonuclease/exonuclease/phosphatase family metal-dependent hydrolase
VAPRARRAQDGGVRLMTRNLYVGASLDPVLGAASLDALGAAVDEVWGEVAASDPPGRMAAIAEEIAGAAPDVVALQEVARWEAAGAAHDFLALLLARLPGYRAAAVVENFGGALPGARAGLVSIRDRGALLVRDGVEVEDARGHRFGAAGRLGTPAGGVDVPRGCVSATVRADGVEARVFGVHLELAHVPDAALVHRAQAAELAAALRAEPRPAAVMGDLNARPGVGAHAVLRAAGLDDAWTAVHGEDPGLTCCERRSLRNERSTLFERIDHVLVRGLRARAAFRTGLARAANGLWPSDHAGVVVELSAGA